MSPRTGNDAARGRDRVDRTVLLVAGAALAGAGCYGLLRANGALGSRAAQDSLITPGAQRLAAGHPALLWTVLGLAAFLVGVAALTWLLAQLRGTRPASDDVVRTGDGGRTTVSGEAVAGALAHDISAYPGVLGARARVGGGTEPAVHLWLDVAEQADLAGIQERIGREALARLAAALEQEPGPAHIEVRLRDQPVARVR